MLRETKSDEQKRKKSIIMKNFKSINQHNQGRQFY